MKDYRNNPELRTAILDQLQIDLPTGNKAEKPCSMIVGSRGERLVMEPNFKSLKENEPIPLDGGRVRSMQLVASQADADKASASLAASIAEACFETCLPPPGDTGEESISAQEEMRMACAWLMSLGEDDAAGALSVIRTLREGWTP